MKSANPPKHGVQLPRELGLFAKTKMESLLQLTLTQPFVLVKARWRHQAVCVRWAGAQGSLGGQRMSGTQPRLRMQPVTVRELRDGCGWIGSSGDEVLGPPGRKPSGKA